MSATADCRGAYTVSGLAAGSYIVKAEFAGFAPFHSATLRSAAGQVKRVEIAMAIQVEQQSVVVTDEVPDGEHRGRREHQRHRAQG